MVILAIFMQKAYVVYKDTTLAEPMVNHCQFGTCKPNHSVKFDSKGNLRPSLTRLLFKVSLHVQISSMWWKLRPAILIHTKSYATQL